MHGSPLFRTLLVVVGLLFAAWFVRMLTSQHPERRTPAAMAAAPRERIETPFELTLSAMPGAVRLETGGETIDLEAGSQHLSGILHLDPERTAIFLKIHWLDPGVVPRFAKLRLDPFGRPTQTQVFDATGDISDVWEPELGTP